MNVCIKYKLRFIMEWGVMHIQIQELNLEGNQITTAGLRGLLGLRRLMKLDLGYNQISDLHPLCGLTGLSQLSLESNLLHK